MNGMRKGAVKAMHLSGDHVRSTSRWRRDIVLTTDSVVAIRNVGLMGEKVIAVDLRSGGAAVARRATPSRAASSRACPR